MQRDVLVAANEPVVLPSGQRSMREAMCAASTAPSSESGASAGAGAAPRDRRGGEESVNGGGDARRARTKPAPSSACVAADNGAGGGGEPPHNDVGVLSSSSAKSAAAAARGPQHEDGCPCGDCPPRGPAEAGRGDAAALAGAVGGPRRGSAPNNSAAAPFSRAPLDGSASRISGGGGGGGAGPVPVPDPRRRDKDAARELSRDRSAASSPFRDRVAPVPVANGPIFGVDRDLRVSEWNEHCIAITGYVTSEVVGRPFLDALVAPSRRGVARTVLGGALQRGEQGAAGADCELEVRTKRGEVRVWRVSARPRLDPQGKVFGVIGVAQDVTDDKKLASMVEQMELSNKRKDEQLESERSMTAYFSHELRNPLHSIDSALQAMPDDLPESAKSLVNAMQLCTSFMSSIMNNLLDVRKIEEGKMVLNYEPMSLSNLARTVLEMLKPSVRPGVTCLIDVDGTTAATAAAVAAGEGGDGKGDWVLADAHRLQQVLTNVVTNAIKYTTEGSVTLRVGWEGGLVRFDCVDTGPGIPKSEQGRLFKKFVQRGGAPGSGLGLAIAKNIVDLGGGTIYFESDPTVRPGTTCVIKLPLRRCESLAEDSSRPDDAAGGAGGARKMIDEPLSFLVIDDIEVNRTMLGRRLKKCIAPNARLIRQAQTGEEAIKICRTERFDVIVVDHHMDEAGGVMLGSDVAIAMRRMGIDDIIIGCSGDEPEAFEGSGCDLVWGKPMPPNATVVRQLSELLSQRGQGGSQLAQPQCLENPPGEKDRR